MHERVSNKRSFWVKQLKTHFISGRNTRKCRACISCPFAQETGDKEKTSVYLFKGLSYVGWSVVERERKQQKERERERVALLPLVTLPPSSHLSLSPSQDNQIDSVAWLTYCTIPPSSSSTQQLWQKWIVRKGAITIENWRTRTYVHTSIPTLVWRYYR